MTPPNRLLILAGDARRYRDLIQAARPPGLTVTGSQSTADLPPELDGCNLILGEPARVAPMLHRLPRLRWIQSTFAGVDALCGPDLPHDYLLTGVKDVFGPLMSEYVFGHILVLERRMAETLADQQAKAWVPRPYRGLQGLTLGLAGLGSIGRHIARTGEHMGMTVVAYKRTPDPAPAVRRIYWGNQLPQFLGSLDFLVLTLPRTPDTTHFINARTLAMMKPSAVLINVGRGNAIAEADLARALKTGVIGGAVLDVFTEEPLPPTSPLWNLPNTIITPHNAAVSFPEDIIPIFLENYRRFQKGEPLKYLIDFERGY